MNDAQELEAIAQFLIDLDRMDPDDKTIDITNLPENIQEAIKEKVRNTAIIHAKYTLQNLDNSGVLK